MPAKGRLVDWYHHRRAKLSQRLREMAFTVYVLYQENLANPYNLVSPSLAVTQWGASKLITYCRRVADCQSKTQSAGGVRNIIPCRAIRSRLRYFDLNIAKVRFTVLVSIDVVNAHLRSALR
jgi:hypothetical protein